MMYDVIVVGAGPGGAASGLLLAQHGLRVLVLDRARFPRPKICGEYLSPEVARVLDRLGVLKTVEDAGAIRLRGMAITAPDGTRLTGTYPSTGRWRGYRDEALALPRERLDRILTDRLVDSPADFRDRHRVTELLVDGHRVVGVRVIDSQGRSGVHRARIVVGADGRHSVVARQLGLVTPHPLQRLALVTYAEDVDGPRDRGRIVVAPPVYSIANPVLPDVANVSIVVPLGWGVAHRGRLEALFDREAGRLPEPWPRLRRVAPVRALGPLAYRVAPPRHRAVLLVGDAAGFYDPFTGEGVHTALRSAELAVDAVLVALGDDPNRDHHLAQYEPTRRQELGGKHRVTRILQFVIGHRTLSNRVARLLARRPQLLDLLMGVLGDFVPASTLLTPAVLPTLRAARDPDAA